MHQSRLLASGEALSLDREGCAATPTEQLSFTTRSRHSGDKVRRARHEPPFGDRKGWLSGPDNQPLPVCRLSLQVRSIPL